MSYASVQVADWMTVFIYAPKFWTKEFSMNTVGPSAKTKRSKQVAMAILTCESFLMPAFNPNETLVKPKRVITIII